MGVASSSVMVGAESIIPLKTPSPAQMPIIPIAMTHKSSTLEKVSRHLRPSFEDVDWSVLLFLFYTLFAIIHAMKPPWFWTLPPLIIAKSGR